MGGVGGGGGDPVDVHTLIFHHYLVACGTTGFRVGGQAIHHMTVSMEPPTLAGSWREATPSFTDIHVKKS